MLSNKDLQDQIKKQKRALGSSQIDLMELKNLDQQLNRIIEEFDLIKEEIAKSKKAD